MSRSLLLFLLGLLVVSCGGPSTNDFDGDGSADSVDCAPDDPSIHLGATELCGDGIDNDCDSWVDCADIECSVLEECDSGDDDDSVVGDDDTSGDDDSAGDDDDDTSGDDDDSAGDDDDTSGDDDDSAGDDDDSASVTPTSIFPQGITMLGLAHGTFQMGCTAAQQTSTSCEADESPPHQVTLTRDFWLSETEITQGQWQSIMGTNPNPSHFGPNGLGVDCGETCPVESVNWWEAAAFASYLSEAEGLQPCYSLTNCSGTGIGFGMSCGGVIVHSPTGSSYDCEGYRLPTEAEWEYAARAGTDLLYAGSDTLGDVAWYQSNSGGTTHPVSTRDPNGWGLYDMSGNVWEWVWDGAAAYGAVPVVDPVAVPSTTRVLRGASWDNTVDTVRVSYRFDEPNANSRYDRLGIRIARTIPVDADQDGLFMYEDCDDGDPSITQGSSELCPGTSCRQLFDDGYASDDGNYWITGSFGTFQVQCDMVNEGWTLVAAAIGGDPPTETWTGSYGVHLNDSALLGATFRFPDDVITDLRQVSTTMRYTKSHGSTVYGVPPQTFVSTISQAFGPTDPTVGPATACLDEALQTSCEATTSDDNTGPWGTYTSQGWAAAHTANVVGTGSCAGNFGVTDHSCDSSHWNDGAVWLKLWLR